MANFLDDNLNQSVFLDINYLEVLGENTFEFCLYQLITHQLDLTEFTRRYKNKSVALKNEYKLKKNKKKRNLNKFNYLKKISYENSNSSSV